MIIYRMVKVEGCCTKLQLLISYIYSHWLTQKYSELWLVRYDGLVWSNIAVTVFYHLIYMIIAPASSGRWGCWLESRSSCCSTRLQRSSEDQSEPSRVVQEMKRGILEESKQELEELDPEESSIQTHGRRESFSCACNTSRWSSWMCNHSKQDTCRRRRRSY